MFAAALAAVLCAGPAGAAKSEDGKAVLAKIYAGLQSACDPALEKEARKRVAANPDDAVGHAMLGAYLACSGRTPPGLGPLAPGVKPVYAVMNMARAVDELRRAVDGYPTLEVAVALFMRVMGQQGLSGEILKYVKSLPPESFTPEAVYELAASLRKLPGQSEAETAIEIADNLLRRLPEREDVRVAVAACWMDAGKLQAGREALAKWLEKTPGNRAFSILLAQADVLAGQVEAGLARAKVFTDEPRMRVLVELGAFLDGKGSADQLKQAVGPDADAAAQAMVAAFAAPEPTRAKALTEAGKKVLETRRFAELFLMIQARKKMGGWGDEEAILEADLYRRSREFPREVVVLLELMPKVDKNGKTDTGVSAAEFHFRAGRAQYHSGRLDESLREYDLALKLGKDDAERDYHIAKTLIAQGKPAEAAAQYRKAMKVNKPEKYGTLAQKELDRQASPAPAPSPSAR